VSADVVFPTLVENSSSVDEHCMTLAHGFEQQ
jgi:hypothetical protein